MQSAASKKEKLTPTGEPAVAVLLTWFVPGAGHLYLGRPVVALVAFVLVQGTYLLGLKLSEGMGFEFLHHELRSAFAPALAPEVGNLGGFIWQSRTYGFGPGYPRAWPPGIHVGVMLTALSGVLNVCWMAQAHADALRPRSRPPGSEDWRRSPAVAACLAWLLPGAGHLLQGRRTRAALVFVVLVGLLVIGTALAEGSNLSRERHYYYWGGQFMAGLPPLLLELLHGHRPVNSYVPYAEAGLVMASIAGLLNVMAMLDVYGYGEPDYVQPKEREETSRAARGAGATA